MKVFKSKSGKFVLLAILSIVIFLVAAFVILNKTISNIIPNYINSIIDTNITANSEYIFDFTEVLPLVQNANSKLTQISNLTKNPVLSKTVFRKRENVQIQTISTLLADLETILTKLIGKPQKWIIIFQNSNELRATGGFMGSYAIVDINEGKIISINTEDIYDADGQFTGYVKAPSGVNEYLSSGNGLRLPDANWNPNLNSSAEQILQFFALGNKQNIAGIIFVNLDFAKELLKITGPIELNDYNTIVTQNNIDEVLRSRRDNFFPGSSQKKHMLSQLLTKVRIKLLEPDENHLLALSDLFVTSLQEKNLQFYSTNQTIEDVFKKHDMKQTVEFPENSEYLYLLESNVGINKANKNVDRSFHLQKDGVNRNITVSFQNKNKKPTASKLTELITDLNSGQQPATQAVEVKNQNSKPASKHLAYINYQRVLVPESWSLQAITYKNKPILEIDEEIIETHAGQKIKQLGFLITLGEEETGNLELEFTTSQDFDKIYIQKQPGIPATNYILEYNQEATAYTLNKNTLLSY